MWNSYAIDEEDKLERGETGHLMRRAVRMLRPYRGQVIACITVLLLWTRMGSLAVEVVRAARLVGAGVEVEPPGLEQAPRSTTARAARARQAARVLVGSWGMASPVT